MTKTLPRAVIVSARGKDSFEPGQLERLNGALSVCHHETAGYRDWLERYRQSFRNHIQSS